MSLSDALGSCHQSIPGIPDLGSEGRRMVLRQRVELRRALAFRDVATLARYLRETPSPERWVCLALADMLEKKRVKGARGPVALWKDQCLAVEVEGLCAAKGWLRETAIWDVVQRRRVGYRSVRYALSRYGKTAKAALATRGLQLKP